MNETGATVVLRGDGSGDSEPVQGEGNCLLYCNYILFFVSALLWSNSAIC